MGQAVERDAPMIGTPGRVPAVGGTRTVPQPDAIARDYLLLALRLDQHVPGLVDGYFGPAVLKAQVDLEQLRPPARLCDDAADLRERVLAEVADAPRRDWLAAQLRALETQAAALTGDGLPYAEHLARCFDWRPVRREEHLFDAAAATLSALLADVRGAGPLADAAPVAASLASRLSAWDARFTIDPDRLPAVANWLVARARDRAAALFGLPAGEDLRVEFVRGQPWSGYNWYEGGGRSRVDINVDLPIRAADLVHTIAHETYPGHHLEHAAKEQVLVEGAGSMEASILLINTPECLVSEGLADVGVGFVAAPDEHADLLVELYERAGLPIATDRLAAREAAARETAMREPRRRLADARGNAALMRHAEGASHEETLAYLMAAGRYTEPLARKRLEFIEHPLWRTYVFVYQEGEALLTRWLALAPQAGRAARFGRLLREQLTPGAIAAEVGERTTAWAP
jgi:hypothetical protein